MRGRDDNYYRSREWKGATHQMVMHSQTQPGDPLKPPGVPPGYEHPAPLNIIIGGAPRALTVTQEIAHGPEQSRSEEFDSAVAQAVRDARIGFHDRRYEGRRHRPGYLYEKPHDPPVRGGWQRDVPHERYRSF